jgi:hypothetical protein
MAKIRVGSKPTRSIRVHSVAATLRNFDLPKAKSAIRLEVFAATHKLGQLEIGRGGLYWWGHKRVRSKRIDWSRFAAMMNKEAYGVTDV